MFRLIRLLSLLLVAATVPVSGWSSTVVIETVPAAVLGPRGAGWDGVALDAFLRTQSGAGDVVATPALGQRVFFHLRFRVDGPAPSADVSLRALIDGAEVCSTASSVGTGTTLIARCNGGWTATAGAHVLEWVIELGALAEANTANNRVTRVWNTGTDLDLSATRVYLRTAPNGGREVVNPAPGEDVYLHLDYQVAGLSPSTTLRVAAELDGQPFCSGSVTPSNGSRTAWCTDPWTATVGVHSASWSVDDDDRIAETSESNNTSVVFWNVLAPSTATVPAGETPSPQPSATPTARSLATPTRPSARFQLAPAVVGDCDLNRRVAINELIAGIGIALGRRGLSLCPQFDDNRDFTVSISELIKAVNVALRGAPEYIPPPDVILQVVPGALLLPAGEGSGRLRVAAYDSQGASLATDDLDIEWISNDPDAVRIAADPANQALATATAMQPIASAIVVARLRDYPRIVSAPVSVSRARLNPEVELLPDEMVVFPPPNIPDGVDVSRMSLADYVAPHGASGEAVFGGFTESEIASYFDVTEDFTIRYPVVVRGAAPEVGQRLLASGGAPLAGVVVAAQRRGDFSLIQMEMLPPQELFEDVDFAISAEQLIEDGLLQPVDTSDWESLESEALSAGAATSGLLSFSLGPFACKPVSLLSVRPTISQAAAATSSYFGPVWDGDLRIRSAHVELFFFKVGLAARAFFKPELRLTPGVQFEYTCDLKDEFRKRRVFPLNGPMALVLAPYIEGLVSFPFKLNVSGGPTARFGVNIGFDYAYWTGGVYTPEAGWEGLCETWDDCSRTNADAQVIWDTDSSLDQVTIEGKVGFAGVLEAGVAGLGPLVALIGRLPVSGILQGAVASVLERLKVPILRGSVGPEVNGRWHNARRTAFLEVSESAANVVLGGDLKVKLDALSPFLRTALGIGGVRSIGLLELEPFHLAEPFRILNEGTVMVNGDRVASGISVDPIEIPRGQSVAVVATVERDFINLTLTQIFLTRVSPHQEFPHIGELWVNGAPIAELSPANEFTLMGSFTAGDSLCDAAAQEAGGVEVKILAFNRMFRVIPTANFVGSFFVKCVDNMRPVVDAGPDQEIETLSATLRGTVQDDGLPDPPGVVTTTWIGSGPGPVAFADSGSLRTTTILPRAGVYRLTLRADDGELVAQDNVTITVRESVDDTPPGVVTDPCGGAVTPGETLRLSVVATDDKAMGSLTIAVPGGISATPTQTVTCQPMVARCTASFSIRLNDPLPAAPFAVDVAAVDAAGNRASDVCSFVPVRAKTPTAGPSPTPITPVALRPKFRKIVGFETTVPGFETTFANWDISRAVLVDGVVVFSATFRPAFNNQAGIFVSDGSTVQTVVLDNMILPGTEGANRVRIRVLRNPMFDGTNIAFTAESGGPGGTGGRHVFRTTVSAGLAGAEPIEGLRQGQMLADNSTSVVFSVALRSEMIGGTASQLGAFFTLLASNSTSLNFVIDSGTAIPGGQGTFAVVDSGTLGLLAKRPVIVFRGIAEGATPSQAGDRGIYLGFADGSVRLVVDESASHPTSRGNFHSFTTPAIDDGVGDVAFAASAGEGLFKEGIFASRAGTLETVADVRTAVPGSVEMFQDMIGAVGFDDGIITFTSKKPPGIFAEVDRQLVKVAAPGDVVDAQVVRFASGANDDLVDSGEIAISLTFETVSGLAGGIYLASF